MTANKYQGSSYFKYITYVILLFASTIYFAVGFNFLDNDHKQYAIGTSLE